MASEIVADCPRCGAKKITFDVLADVWITQLLDWIDRFETFCVCRGCQRSTVFLLDTNEWLMHERIRELGPAGLKEKGSIDSIMKNEGHVTAADFAAFATPEHVPEDLAGIFHEGAKCIAVGCWNAAGAMFRLCIDKATRPLLPDAADGGGPNARTRDRLGPRIDWLVENNRLAPELHELADCVREDGNDAVHAGTLTSAEAHDLADFTIALLDRIYTARARIKAAKDRRDVRRAAGKPAAAA